MGEMCVCVCGVGGGGCLVVLAVEKSFLCSSFSCCSFKIWGGGGEGVGGWISNSFGSIEVSSV